MILYSYEMRYLSIVVTQASSSSRDCWISKLVCKSFVEPLERDTSTWSWRWSSLSSRHSTVRRYWKESGENPKAKERHKKDEETRLSDVLNTMGYHQFDERALRRFLFDVHTLSCQRWLFPKYFGYMGKPKEQGKSWRTDVKFGPRFGYAGNTVPRELAVRYRWWPYLKVTSFGRSHRVHGETQTWRARKEIEGTGCYQVRRGSCIHSLLFPKDFGNLRIIMKRGNQK